MELGVELGSKIKRMRIKMNLTQEDLANRCDLSKGFISQLERDKVSPSIATLRDILECLGSNLKDFFNSDETVEKVVYTREDINEVSDTELGYIIDWLIPTAQKNEMEPILLRLSKGGRSGQYDPYEGEIFGYVLSGSITLVLEDKNHKVKKGESFYYKANNSHHIKNSGKAEAAVLWISIPPCF